MKIILFDYVEGCEVTVQSGNQKDWDRLTGLERKIIRTLLDHDNSSRYTGKRIKMGSVLARMELDEDRG